MGLIQSALRLVTGGHMYKGIEIFRENQEASAKRAFDLRAASLGQFAQEFTNQKRSWFDQVIDGINRLPRPMMALGVIGLFGAAMVDPIWFASRMQGIALVPEPLWWLLGAIVSFYFGARHQTKGQEFRKSMDHTIDLAKKVNANIAILNSQTAEEPANVSSEITNSNHQNRAFQDWLTKNS